MAVLPIPYTRFFVADYVQRMNMFAFVIVMLILAGVGAVFMWLRQRAASTETPLPSAFRPPGSTPRPAARQFRAAVRGAEGPAPRAKRSSTICMRLRTSSRSATAWSRRPRCCAISSVPMAPTGMLRCVSPVCWTPNWAPSPPFAAGGRPGALGRSWPTLARAAAAWPRPTRHGPSGPCHRCGPGRRQPAEERTAGALRPGAGDRARCHGRRVPGSRPGDTARGGRGQLHSEVPPRPDEAELAEARARFFREAKTAGRLNHAGIVTIYDVGEERGLAYIAMEYLQGPAPRATTRRRRGCCEPGKVLELVGANRGSAGTSPTGSKSCHRDVEPANLMYEPAPMSLKITDFGIARMTVPAAPAPASCSVRPRSCRRNSSRGGL